MTQYEKEEIATLPEKYRPIGAWGYFGMTLLFNIPLIGFICLIVFACSGSNINRRSFARSYFCGAIIVAVLVAVIIIITVVAGGGFGFITEILDKIKPQA